jgi:hypothetical protein
VRRLGRDQQVVRDAQRAERLKPLEGASKPQAGSSADREPGDVPPQQHDAARAGTQLTADDVEQRGLARTVRPDQPDDRPRLDGERHIAQYGHAPVPGRDALYLQRSFQRNP